MLHGKSHTFEEAASPDIDLKRSKTHSSVPHERKRSSEITAKLSKQIFKKLIEANNVIAKEDMGNAILNRRNSLIKQRSLGEIQEDISIWGEFYADAIP